MPHLSCFHNCKFDGNPEIKIASGFKLRTFKTFKIWKLTFRVPKKCMSGLPYLQMGWGKVFKNICFYNQENPKSVTQQSVLTETAFRLESSSRNMWWLKPFQFRISGKHNYCDLNISIMAWRPTVIYYLLLVWVYSPVY